MENYYSAGQKYAGKVDGNLEKASGGRQIFEMLTKCGVGFH